ncbi:Transcription elongation factor SPT4 [Sporothrix epigloea]|uniref:Transcription elongation factor SPT4 n=1 Tax=Sporothrix epigloea TaxID=1892477 RepID=A0ABP0DKF9_9PEZI
MATDIKAEPSVHSGSLMPMSMGHEFSHDLGQDLDHELSHTLLQNTSHELSCELDHEPSSDLGFTAPTLQQTATQSNLTGSPNSASGTAPVPTPKSTRTTKSSQTPSPSASFTGHSAPAPKRPTRKSTLTQQQKNHKRQRATQDQLATLEIEFNKNPTPNAETRLIIADQINMTERSVQIWFQNRLETGEDIDAIPESMRAYLAMQAAESGRGLGGAYYGRTGMMGYGPGMLLGGEPANQSKVLIHHLTCRSLSIGKWVRVGQSTMDLIIFYSPQSGTMTYYINDENAGYKIEYPFSYIKNIYLDQDEDPQRSGGIVIELLRPPTFMMDCTPSASGFTICGDFTENQQASQCFVHHLGGNPKVLSGQLAKLISLDTFMTRHSPHNSHNIAAATAAANNATSGGPIVPLVTPLALDVGSAHNFSVSAPVSPTARPSSQPNFWQPHVGIFQETQWGINAMAPGMRPGPGHKRQRSRSVPMAIDFSMLQTPMPSFYIQHPGESHPQPHSPDIYAPIPHNPIGLGPAGPGLRIDTQAGFGLDMRQHPMSATTAPSPSEYSSPNFFAPPDNSGGPESASIGAVPSASSYNTPYGGPFLSPMVAAQTGMIPPPSVSPLSFVGSISDPTIVDQSPPMAMMGHNATPDIYHSINGNSGIDSSAISNDGSNINDLYSKHAINVLHHPHSPGQYADNQAELDMSQLVQFDAADAASLSPESLPPHSGA